MQLLSSDDRVPVGDLSLKTAGALRPGVLRALAAFTLLVSALRQVLL